MLFSPLKIYPFTGCDHFQNVVSWPAVHRKAVLMEGNVLKLIQESSCSIGIAYSKVGVLCAFYQNVRVITFYACIMLVLCNLFAI